MTSEPSLTFFQSSTEAASTEAASTVTATLSSQTSLLTPTPTIILGGGPLSIYTVTVTPSSTIVFGGSESLSLTIPEPSIATASGSIPSQIPDTTLCNIAFSGALRYDFVLSNEEAVTDIFYYTPKAIAYALNLTDTTNISMNVIQPANYNGSTFDVTSVLFYIPSNFVEPLGQEIAQTNSHFHSDSSDNNLNVFIGIIDPTYPLTASIGPGANSPYIAITSTVLQTKPLITTQMVDSTTSHTAASTPSQSSSGSSSAITSGPPSVISSGPSSAIKAGIGVGTALGAIALLILIVFFGLRYRKKARINHLLTRDTVPQQMLEKDGQPRSELGGKMQPAEKDSVVRNELYSNVPTWELLEDGHRISDYHLDTDASLTSRDHMSDNV